MSGELLSTPTTPQMPKEEREKFAAELREKLNSRRDVFVIDKFMFEPNGAQRLVDQLTIQRPRQEKHVSAATLKLLLDYCESEWPMDFVSYCAGIFHGREALQDETAFDLLPDVQSRLSADRLGFGHIYGSDT